VLVVTVVLVVQVQVVAEVDSVVLPVNRQKMEWSPVVVVVVLEESK